MSATAAAMGAFKPLTEYGDYFTFDYKTLYPDNWFFDMFMQPVVPFVSVVLYLVLSKPVFNFIVTQFKISPKSAALKNFITLHSGLLAVYSGWTFVNIAWLVFKHYQMTGNMYDTLTASKESLWDGTEGVPGMSFWITHFYISKYYEFIDTWVVLLKGRDPILLQTYHHAGIVLVMWALCATHCSPVIVLVFLNSFIHTLMYTYYTASAFGYSSPLKHYLTSMQIIQFIVGIATTCPTHFMTNATTGKPLLTDAQGLALWSVELYAVVLIVLFAQFYTSTYLSKGKKAGGKKVE